MLKALANPMESILVGKFFTKGMETQCARVAKYSRHYLV